MNSSDAPTFFDCCRTWVAELVDAGAGNDVVEQTIDAYALDADEKDALWLWARGQRDRHVGDVRGRQLVGRPPGAVLVAQRRVMFEGIGHD